MIKLDIEYKILSASYEFIRMKHNSDKILVFEKDNLLFVFNWHTVSSYTSYPIYTKHCRNVKVLWSTDDK
jgi:1,4-alpha-glucan branching enzyme